MNNEARLAEAETLIREAYTIAAEPAAAEPLIVERIVRAAGFASSAVSMQARRQIG